MRIVRRFHREEEAQLTFLAIAAVMCFMGLVAMVINTNELVTESVHMQDVADVTALSAAAWTARGYNIVSFINVFNSKLISTAVLLNALKDALPIIEKVGIVQETIFQACSGVPYVGVFCTIMATIIKIQLKALTVLMKIIDPLQQNLSKCKNGVLWGVMNGLSAMAEVVKTTFPAIGIAESIDIAKANGASEGIAVNGAMLKFDPESALFLSITDEKKFQPFCAKMQSGGPGYELQKYECGKGPLKTGEDRINLTLLLPFTNLFAQPIFAGMVMAHTAQVGCTGELGKQAKVKVTLKDLQQCKQYDADSLWSHTYAQTFELDDPNLTRDDFVPWRPVNKSEGGKDASDADGTLEDLEGLGDLNLGDVDLLGAGEDNFQPGPAYQFIDGSTETEVKKTLEMACGFGNGQPFYLNPGNDNPGAALEVCLGGFGCDRMDDRSEFAWYSGTTHTRGQPVPGPVGGYFLKVSPPEEIPPAEEGGATKYRYHIEAVSLYSAGEKDMDIEEFQEYLSDQGVDAEESQDSASCDKPDAWTLVKGDTDAKKEEFQEKLRFLSFVWYDLEADPPFWSRYFKNPPKKIYGYAQAQVYNHLSEDTFTQDWRVRLEKASLLETFLASGENSSGFGSGGGFESVIGSANNH